jgi:hypothetical protein
VGGATLRLMADGARNADVLEPDPVIEAYKRDIDRTLLRERLARTPAERVEDLVALARFADALQAAGRLVKR